MPAVLKIGLAFVLSLVIAFVLTDAFFYMMGQHPRMVSKLKYALVAITFWLSIWTMYQGVPTL